MLTHCTLFSSENTQRLTFKKQSNQRFGTYRAAQARLSAHPSFDKTSQLLSVLLKNPFHFKGTLVWRHVCTAEEEIPARKQEYRKITPMIDQHSLNSFSESLLRNRKCALHTTWGDEVIKCGSGGPHQFSNRREMIEMLEVPWQVIHARHM